MYSKSPLKPFDPVIELPGQRAYQYLQNNFYQAGQDSFTRPFSQNQELFQSLTNVMPVAQGSFRLRHGYQLLNNPGIGTISRLYSYQNVATGTRKLVYIGGTAVDISNEDGSSISSIITAINANPRAVVSRDYLYVPAVASTTTFPSGEQSDGKKWHSVNGLSTFGLPRPPGTISITSTAVAGNVTLASTKGRVYAGAYLNSTTGQYSDTDVSLGSFTSGQSGPTGCTADSQTATGLVSWSNLNNIQVQDTVTSTAVLSPASPGSEVISATGFGFAIAGTSTITGIAVQVIRQATGASNTISDNTLRLLKAGVAVGTDKADPAIWINSLAAFNYGGSNDLWGTTWTPAEVNAANFGMSISAGLTNIGFVGNTTAGIDFISITIFFSTGNQVQTGAITGKQVSLALPTSNPPTGVDKFVINATLDGGDTTTLYILDTVPIATTTYIDNIPDGVLVTKNIAALTDDSGVIHGIFNNKMPPLGLQFPTKHRGRLYGAVGETIFFSKSLDEVITSTGLILGRFEECWPATNSIDVSTQKETIRGLISDGTTLYIGTERRIWRLDGDGPLNFSKPEIIFNEVGILNQDVWQVCFAEGQPVGIAWLTPDNRVIMSNFAHYQDIGTPIQDILSSTNSTATNPPWAAFFSRQEFDVYVLAIPTGSNNSPDTLCVYDLRGGRWYIWKLADTPTAALFNINLAGTPQWIVAASTGKTYQFLPTLTQDRVNDTPIAISYTITTPWLHFGRPTERKSWNSLEIITADTGMLVGINGASLNSQTGTPNVVVANQPLASSQFGYFKIYLAGKTSRDKHYQLTFSGSSGIQDILLGYTAELLPFAGF